MERDDGFGLAVLVASNHRIGPRKVQFDGGDRQPVDGALHVLHEPVRVLVVVRLPIKSKNYTNKRLASLENKRTQVKQKKKIPIEIYTTAAFLYALPKGKRAPVIITARAIRHPYVKLG